MVWPTRTRASLAHVTAAPPRPELPDPDMPGRDRYACTTPNVIDISSLLVATHGKAAAPLVMSARFAEQYEV